ncbi:hypothetical protein Tco_1279067 [Tanacetum coccineum]
MINMDTMKIKATKVEITRRKEDDLPGYKNDHKHYKKSYKKSDGGFNQKMDQEDLKTYTAAFTTTVAISGVSYAAGNLAMRLIEKLGYLRQFPFDYLCLRILAKASRPHLRP